GCPARPRQNSAANTEVVPVAEELLSTESGTETKGKDARLFLKATNEPVSYVRVSIPSINPIGETAKDQVDHCVGNRKHVLYGQGVRRAAHTSFDGFDRHFLVAEALVEQHADDVGLEAEAAGVGMPAHHVVAQVHRKAVVIIEAKAADEIDDAGIGV